MRDKHEIGMKIDKLYRLEKNGSLTEKELEWAMLMKKTLMWVLKQQYINFPLFGDD